MEIKSACWAISTAKSFSPPELLIRLRPRLNMPLKLRRKAEDTFSAIPTLFIRESTLKTALQCLRRQKNMDSMNNSSVPKNRCVDIIPLLHLYPAVSALHVRLHGPAGYRLSFPFSQAGMGNHGHAMRSARFRRILVDPYLYPACIHSYRQVEQD